MMHGNTRKGLVALACWLLAILLLAGCSGNSSEGDLVVPTVSFDGAGAVTTTRTRYLSGSVEAGATVEVMVGTEEVPADQVHVAGERWSCEIDNLQAGSNLITVTALDPAGNQNILNFYLTYDAAEHRALRLADLRQRTDHRRPVRSDPGFTAGSDRLRDARPRRRWMGTNGVST